MQAAIRLQSLREGETLSPKLSMIWSASPGHSCDAIVTNQVSLNHAIATHNGQLVLCEVHSPLGRIVRSQPQLLDTLRETPADAEDALLDFANEAKNEIREAFELGAHGIFYRLSGANPKVTTPMEYGGHFLEMDKELMAHASSGLLNVISVEDGPEIYIDAVAEVPGHAIHWDNALNELSIEAVRTMTTKFLVLDHPVADIHFAHSQEEIDRLQERSTTGSN